MNIDEFMASLGFEACPQSVSKHLQALWHDAKGDWHRAHEIVQAMPDTGASRIHAYLHRKEGDDGNARYWHRRAGTAFPAGQSLDEEWQALVARFCDK